MADVDFDQLEAVLDREQQTTTNPTPAAQYAPQDSTGRPAMRRDDESSVRHEANGSARSPRDDRRRRSRSSSVRRRSGRYESARSDSTRDRYLERERRQSSRSAPRDVRHSRRRPRSRSSGSRGRSSRHSGSRLSSRSHHRSRTRSPSNKEHHNEEKRLEELRRKEEERRRQEEERRLKEEEEKRRRELDEARRDDLTVLIMNLCLKATERDVWKFFSERAGKVRDIQIIRDSRSGKSKGVGYVEFYSPQAVLQALALSGSYILDIPIIVQASQAEKNRAAKAAKQQAAEITEGGPMKVYVGGLVDSLSTLTESDLKQLFSPFGDIVNVDLPKDPYTGRCKGYGFIQFRQSQDAREAMAAMNGFEIGGKQIKVGYATDAAQRSQLMPLGTGDTAHGLPLGTNLSAAQTALQTALMYAESQADNERLDDEGGGLLSGVNPRISLMQKLQRLDSNSGTAGGMSRPGVATPTGGALPTVTPPFLGLLNAAPPTGAIVPNPTAPYAGGVSAVPGGIIVPPLGAATLPATAPTVFSSNICLDGLFTPNDVQAEGPSFFDEIIEDVRTECSKYGVVLQVWLSRAKVDGKVWVKFGGPDQAVKANQALNGRYFAGNRISVTFVSDATWATTCV